MAPSYPLSVYLPALALTLAVELPVLALLLRGRVPVRRALLAGVLASGFTHPQLWYLWPRLFDDYWTYLVTCELAIVGIEAGIVWLVCRRRVGGWLALGASGLANGASYLTGWLLRGVLFG